MTDPEYYRIRCETAHAKLTVHNFQSPHPAVWIESFESDIKNQGHGTLLLDCLKLLYPTHVINGKMYPISPETDEERLRSFYRKNKFKALPDHPIFESCPPHSLSGKMSEADIQDYVSKHPGMIWKVY